MLDRDKLDRIDDLVRYIGPDAQPHSAVASGYLMSDLYREKVFNEDHMQRLEEIAELVRYDGHVVDDEELLDAWLTAFEVLASVRPADLERLRTRRRLDNTAQTKG